MQEDEEIMISISDDRVMEAKRKEIESWIENDVFEEVEWEGQPMISVRWIVTEKMKKEGKKIKVRLVARDGSNRGVTPPPPMLLTELVKS